MGASEVIALGSLLLALILAFTNSRRNVKSDAATDAKETAEMHGMLVSIRNGVDDMRVELRTERSRVDQLAERVAAAEGSCKSMHKRLDDHMHHEHGHAAE